jgi:hypothetical protein
VAVISIVGTMATANNNTGFATSIALSPTNVGDLMVVVIELKYSAASNRTVTGISGTGITWQGTATFQRFMADGIHAVEVWYGVATATGSHTHTVSYSSTTGQTAGSINGHELTSTAGASTVWSVDTTGFNDPNTNATTFNYPTLTSAVANEAYVGYLAIASSASTGSTSGFTFYQDLRGNWDCVNPNVGARGTAATASQTSASSQLWFTVGVLFAANVQPLAATGLASTTGAAALLITEPLKATGLASTSGAFALPIAVVLTATGLVATTGLASLAGALTPGLSTDGLVSTTGAMNLVVKLPLAAGGLASTSGSFLLLGRVVDPFKLVVGPWRSPLLGCGTWRLFLATRGGGQLLTEIAYETLTIQRTLDSASVASAIILADRIPSCAPLLAAIEPFEHELVAFRDYLPGDPQDWAGPVMVPTWDPLSLHIDARDLFSWFDVRNLPLDRTFVGQDLADIFTTYISDALSLDPSPNISVMMLGEIGISGQRSVTAQSATICGDALRELSRSGVDFTAVGRTIRIGGPPPSSATTILYDGAIQKDAGGATPKLTKQGLNLATSVVLKGGQDVLGNTISTTAGQSDGIHGLVSRTSSEPLILDPNSLSQAANGRLAFLNPAPLYLTVTLSPQASIQWDELIPGIRIDTAFTLGLIDVVGQFRLQQVDVTVDQNGEAVALTLTPLGVL